MGQSLAAQITDNARQLVGRFADDDSRSNALTVHSEVHASWLEQTAIRIIDKLEILTTFDFHERFLRLDCADLLCQTPADRASFVKCVQGLLYDHPKMLVCEIRLPKDGSWAMDDTTPLFPDDRAPLSDHALQRLDLRNVPGWAALTGLRHWSGLRALHLHGRLAQDHWISKPGVNRLNTTVDQLGAANRLRSWQEPQLFPNLRELILRVPPSGIPNDSYDPSPWTIVAPLVKAVGKSLRFLCLGYPFVHRDVGNAGDDAYWPLKVYEWCPNLQIFDLLVLHVTTRPPLGHHIPLFLPVHPDTFRSRGRNYPKCVRVHVAWANGDEVDQRTNVTALVSGIPPWLEGSNKAYGTHPEALLLCQHSENRVKRWLESNTTWTPEAASTLMTFAFPRTSASRCVQFPFLWTNFVTPEDVPFEQAQMPDFICHGRGRE